MIYVVLILILVILVLPLLVSKRSNDLSRPFEGKTPMVASRYFRCKEHKYRRLVSFYDFDDPPTCPTCGKNLVKGGR